MSDFRMVAGFEEAWRPPVARRRTPETVLRPGGSGPAIRARLARLVHRAPEVMVKVTGSTRDPAHLQAHLDYVSRNGALEVESPDGWPVLGRAAVRELAVDWGSAALLDSRRRANTPVSLSLVLSMPPNTDPYVVRDAARAFAAERFGERFDYVLVLHTDEPHPHVHLAIRTLGHSGERLNLRKADLEAWRQTFAAALRDRGVEAEATPRRARGLTRKPERMPIRQIRERAEAGRGPVGRVQRSVYQTAARAAFGGETTPTAWEAALLKRQQRIRALYLGQARLLQTSTDPADQQLGREVEAFVRDMPAPDTERLSLARDLRETNKRLRSAREGRDFPPPGPQRSR